MIESLHTGMMAKVKEAGELSNSFPVSNVVKQGWVLAPTLFSIFVSAMLAEAFKDLDDGIYIQSRQDADLFNVTHFKAKTKSIQVLVWVLLFADDSALVAHTPEQIQQIVDAFSAASRKFGVRLFLLTGICLHEPLIVCHPWLGHLSEIDLPVPSHEGPHPSEWVQWCIYVVQILPPLITTVVR